jgi:3-aminobutyryl-CoA ammonia-lyase
MVRFQANMNLIDDAMRSTAERNSPPLVEARLRLRMSSQDAHYAGNLVDGARMLALFGDLATELLIRFDGDEGLFRAYESVEFLAPVYGGDYIEAVGRITQVGKTSRTMEFEARKVIQPLPPERGGRAASSAEVLAAPMIVCRARGTCVTPLALQRGQGK